MKKLIKHNLNTKAFLSIFLLLSGICALIYTILIINIPSTFVDNYKNEISRDIDQTLSTHYALNSIYDLQNVLGPIAEKYNITITVSDYTGETLVYEITDNSNTDKEDLEYLELGYITYSNDVPFIINSWISPTEEIRVRDVLIEQIPTFFCIILGISIGTSFIVARLITRPIVRLSETSKELTLNSDVTMPYLERKDEIGQLANNLSNMYTSLQQSLETEQHQSTLRNKLFQSVSHELKTPITVLQGELEGMLYNMGDYKDRDTYIAHSLEVVQDMAQLVQRILMLSKSSTSYIRLDYNVSELVFKQCERYTSLANQNSINLICEAPAPAMITIDKEAFARVISNLLSNAIKYSPSGATVTAHVEVDHLFIENTGVFIPNDRINDLFEPFVRLEESHNHDLGGSGLGLYIVKTILDAHGMNYKIENTDEGVRFTITF